MNDMISVQLNSSSSIKNNNNGHKNSKYLEDKLIKIKYNNLLLKDYNNQLNFSHKFDNNKYIIKFKQNKKFNTNEIIHIQLTLEVYNIEKIMINNNTINICNEYETSFQLSTKKYTEIEFYTKKTNFSINIKNIKYLKSIINHIKIDKIYIINLLRCVDRKNLMINKLKQLEIYNFEFIEAIDGENISDEFENLKKNNKTNIITKGHYACSKSHIKTLNKIYNSEFENVLILEDDVIFRDDFIDKIKNIKVPDYDIIYFGGLVDFNKLFVNGWAIHNEIMGMYAYMVNKKIIPSIIEKIKTFKTYCDVTIKNNFQQCSILLNDIIYTNLDDSFTSDKTQKTCEKIDKQLKQLI